MKTETESFKEESFNKNTLQTLFFAYRPFLGRALLALFLGFIGRGLLLGNANIIGYWVDSLCIENCRSLPSFMTGLQSDDFLQILLFVATGGFIFTVIFRVIFSRLSAQAVSRIYDEVTYRTSRYPMSFFDNNPTGRIVTRFSSDYGNVFRLFGGPLAEFMAIIFDLLMMVILITVASPYYLFFVVIIIICNYFVYRFNRLRLRRLRRDLSSSRSPSIAHFAETTQGASAIRTFRREISFTQRFNNLDQFFLQKKLTTIRASLGFSFQMNSLSALLLLIVGVSAYYFVKWNWVSIGSIGVAFAFIALSGNTVQMFFEWLTQLEEALIGVERLDRYLRAPIEPGSYLPLQAEFLTDHPRKTTGPTAKEEIQQSLKTLNTTAVSVEIHDLWFRYFPEQPWILKGIHLQIKPGEKWGVIGRTGSGKSSLIQALFYLYPLQKGSITLNHLAPNMDSTNTLGVDLQDYRQQIALIAQDPVLFLGTLRENLDINNSHSDQEILSILDKVDLKDWVLHHKNGLNMRIEEKGKNLSMGERQLICMARCLLQKAPLVIMDEATSSVDPQSEEIMVKATEKLFKDRTQIIIAHRLSTLEKCDKVLWLDHGQIKKMGPAKEVLESFERESLNSIESESDLG